MARKKTKKKTAKKGSKRATKDATPFIDRAGELMRSGGGRALAVLALLGATALALGVGMNRLEARASTMIATAPDEIEFAWPVVTSIRGDDGPIQWPPRDVQQRLLELAHTRAAQHPDPLSPDALAAIGEDLRASGLLEEIDAVRRRPGGRIEIQGRWRLPVAAVRHNDRDLFVGRGAVLLPISAEPGQRDVPVVLGAAYNPPKRSDGSLAYAEAWPGEDVQAGLKVVDVLRDKPYWHQVKAIDVSGHALRQMIEIVTDRGTRVVWGAPPGEFKPGEVDTKTKLGHLQALFERYTRIDAGQNRVTVFYEYTDVDRSASGGE